MAFGHQLWPFGPYSYLVLLPRSELGEELKIVCLEMKLEDQMERVRSRHAGDDNSVNRMKVMYYMEHNMTPDTWYILHCVCVYGTLYVMHYM